MMQKEKERVTAIMIKQKGKEKGKARAKEVFQKMERPRGRPRGTTTATVAKDGTDRKGNQDPQLER